MKAETINILGKTKISKKEENNAAATGCCGGAPVSNEEACCKLDEEKKAEGENGCGCETTQSSNAASCCG